MKIGNLGLSAVAVSCVFVSACGEQPQVVDTTLPDAATEKARDEAELMVKGSGAISASQAALAAPSTPAVAEPTTKAAEAWSSEEKRLVETWQDLNGRCRGGSGDDPNTMVACDERDGPVAAQLANANICYGREGEFGYQMELHRCGPTSSRFNRSE